MHKPNPAQASEIIRRDGLIHIPRAMAGKYAPTQKLFDEISQYAVLVTNLRGYENDKNGKNCKVAFDKRYEEQVNSKVAEFAVKEFFGLEENPDMSLRAHSRGHDPDFIIPDVGGIGVKSCRQPRSFPISWVFQSNDPVKDSFYVFCIVKYKTGSYIPDHAYLSWIVSPDLVRELKEDLIVATPKKFAVYERALKRVEALR